MIDMTAIIFLTRITANNYYNKYSVDVRAGLLMPRSHLFYKINFGRRVTSMSKWKIAETILAAVGLLLTAAKALMKFVGLIDKLQTKPAESG